MPKPTGGLDVVKRLTDEEISRREADFNANGSVFCYNCGGQFKEVIDLGTFKYNEQTRIFDIPSPGNGRVVEQCPKCSFIDNKPHGLPWRHGICHETASTCSKGEWRDYICNSEHCKGKGKPYITMGCPGCGEYTAWHIATNGPKDDHGWQIQIVGDVLTMSPSLVHPWGTNCHFFIKNNQVQWC